MNIKKYRLKRLMSQDELAEKMEVSQSTISMWENGGANPRADKIQKIAEVLDCTIDDLFA